MRQKRGVRGRIKRVLRPIFQPLLDEIYRFAHPARTGSIKGVTLLLRHPEISARMFKLLIKGRYEMAEQTLLSRWLNTEDRVLECGSAIGFLALYSIKVVGIKEYALVEPNPRLREVLEENFSLNGSDLGRTPFIEAAVTAKDGAVDFSLHRNFFASSTRAFKNATKTVQVRALSLPAISASLPFVPNTLIMDIEGGEVDLPPEHFLAFDKILLETHEAISGPKDTDHFLTSLSASFVIRDRIGAIIYLERR